MLPAQRNDKSAYLCHLAQENQVIYLNQRARKGIPDNSQELLGLQIVMLTNDKQ